MTGDTEGERGRRDRTRIRDQDQRARRGADDGEAVAGAVAVEIAARERHRCGIGRTECKRLLGTELALAAVQIKAQIVRAFILPWRRRDRRRRRGREARRRAALLRQGLPLAMRSISSRIRLLFVGCSPGPPMQQARILGRFEADAGDIREVARVPHIVHRRSGRTCDEDALGENLAKPTGGRGTRHERSARRPSSWRRRRRCPTRRRKSRDRRR